MKTTTFLTILSLLLPHVASFPLPPETSPNNSTLNALHGNYNLWCLNVNLTLECENSAGQYHCLDNGAPDRLKGKRVGMCERFCTCQKDCTYVKLLYSGTLVCIPHTEVAAIPQEQRRTVGGARA